MACRRPTKRERRLRISCPTVVDQALDSMPRARRREDSEVVETIRLAVRRAADTAWGKKAGLPRGRAPDVRLVGRCESPARLANRGAFQELNAWVSELHRPNPKPSKASICETALEERYLAYALSTIMHRALPDARDGLKPVHRRILYGMHILRLDPGAAFKKCAKIVGDVMGSFHPHGDQAIYDALVRLAQDFASRYPLIEGQGNFGNIDGDSAAAYRYTEARMTDVARALLDGIDENTVDFRPNYSGEGEEPVVLPGAFPNLLANGASGIAVGMATSIPPHNAAELCDAALHLIKHPGATVDKLVQFVPGPDFPTGGIIVDARQAIVEAYRTGRGSFRTRARWIARRAGPRSLADRRPRDSRSRCRRAGWSKRSPSSSPSGSCRCWATCATSWRKTSAWCSNRRAAPSTRPC